MKTGSLYLTDGAKQPIHVFATVMHGNTELCLVSYPSVNKQVHLIPYLCYIVHDMQMLGFHCCAPSHFEMLEHPIEINETQTDVNSLNICAIHMDEETELRIHSKTHFTDSLVSVWTRPRHGGIQTLPVIGSRIRIHPETWYFFHRSL